MSSMGLLSRWKRSAALFLCAGFPTPAWLAALPHHQPRSLIEIYSPATPAPAPPVSLWPVGAELPPLIYHLKAVHPHPSVLALVLEASQLSEPLVGELVAFGAVWLALPRKLRKGVTASAGVGHTVRATSVAELATTLAPPGTYVRVHVHPRRYADAHGVDWRSRVIGISSTFVCVDKPSGVPMAPTVDNSVECVETQLARALGLSGAQPLFVTGRLDACTTGAVVFARSAAAAAAINEALQQRTLRKVYRALCTRPVALGPVRHAFRRKSRRHPDAKPTLLRAFDSALVSAEAGAEWQLAELLVRSCTRLEQPSSLAPELYECELELLTGRTHQIRLQFAALGAPLFGDSRYAPVSGLLDSPDESWGDGGALFGPEPKRIGLQCAELRIPRAALGEPLARPPEADDAPSEVTVLSAGAPWWRPVGSPPSVSRERSM